MNILKKYAFVGLLAFLPPLTISPLLRANETNITGYISTKASWLSLLGILALDNSYTKPLVQQTAINPSTARGALTLATAGLVGLNALQMYYSFNKDTQNTKKLGNKTFWQSGRSFARGVATLGLVGASIYNNKSDLKLFGLLSCASLLPALFYHGFIINVYQKINDVLEGI